MITGFNTDIKYEGVTYHVQTEDKGLDTPLILSLIYQGGTILASKRSPYDDLLQEGFDEKVLAERLNRQHKLLCAAIRAGRIEDLKRMTMKDSAQKQKGLIAKKEVLKEAKVTEEPTDQSIPKPTDSLLNSKPKRTRTYTSELNDKIKSAKSIAKTPEVTEKKDADVGIPKPSTELDFEIPIIEDVEIIEEPTIYDAVQELEEEIVLPPEAVEIIGDLSQFENLVGNELKIKFIGEEGFISGENKNVNILVCRGNEENAVENANVMIKVLGSSFRPLIFHSKTDSNGVASIMLKIPSFRSGRAAILVRAMIKGEETELRRVISQKR